LNFGVIGNKVGKKAGGMRDLTEGQTLRLHEGFS
jgi:hypothetical protein